MQLGNQYDLDVDEARIVISLKNDEISNLKASLKAAQIRNNMKLADLQYKIDHFQNKATVGQTKYTKIEQNMKKQRAHLQDQINKLQSQIEKIREANQNTQTQFRQKERELKGAIYEQRMKLQKQKQANYRLGCELQLILKYFDPKKVLVLLQKQRLEEVPSYMQLFTKFINMQQSLQYANLQMSTMKSQTMFEIQKSFLEMSSYESVMQDLKLRNEQLRLQITEKETELQLHSQEISSKKHLLMTVQKEAHHQIEHLSSELLTLRGQVGSYSNQEDGEREKVRERDASIYLDQIESLEGKLALREAELENQMTEYEDKIGHYQDVVRALRSEMQEMQLMMKQNEEIYRIRIANLQVELEDGRKMIALMDESIKDHQQMNGEQKRQNQNLVREISELLKSKRKLTEEYRVSQQDYKSQFVHLTEEIQFLKGHMQKVASEYDLQSRRSNYYRENSNESNSENNSKKESRAMSGEGSFKNEKSSRNLLFDLHDKINLDGDEELKSNVDFGQYQHDPGWSDKYYSLLQKHNEFVKKVFSRLKGLTIKK